MSEEGLEHPTGPAAQFVTQITCLIILMHRSMKSRQDYFLQKFRQKKLALSLEKQNSGILDFNILSKNECYYKRYSHSNLRAP